MSSNQMCNGDRVYISNNGSWVYCDPNNTEAVLPFSTDSKYTTAFNLIKVIMVQNGNCNGSDVCASFISGNMGDPIYYGDTVYLWVSFQGNNQTGTSRKILNFPIEVNRDGKPLQLGNAGSTNNPDYIVDINGCPTITNGASANTYSQAGFCGYNQQKNGNQNASRGIFSIVSTNGTGYVEPQSSSGCVFSSTLTNQPVKYGDSIALQVVFEDCCQRIDNESNTWLYYDSGVKGNGTMQYKYNGFFGASFNLGTSLHFPNPGKNPNFFFTFIKGCSYENNCNGKCTMPSPPTTSAPSNSSKDLTATPNQNLSRAGYSNSTSVAIGVIVIILIIIFILLLVFMLAYKK